jgi:hypothetical protein
VTAGAALVACTPGTEPDGPLPPPPVDPDVALREQATARESALIAAYDAAIAGAPALAGRLAPLRAEHAAHLAALQEPAAGATAGGPATTMPVRPARPTTATLVAAERSAARAHALGARTASPALAQVLASLAASEASHEIALA